jgi:NADPH-dependent ferric siderophore reductase
MSDKMPSRGFQGAVLKLLRAGDDLLTVTGRRELTPHYLRLSFDAGGLLTEQSPTPPPGSFLEAGHDDDKQLPVARSADVVWVDRKNGGEALVQAVSSSAFDAADHFGWVACDNRTTRAVAKIFREEYKIPRKSIKAHAYWVA